MNTWTRILVAVVVVLALGVGVVLLLHISLDWEKAEVTQEVREATGESYVALSDGVTEYQLSGPDSAQTVIMISGASVPYYILDGTYEALVEAGFRVLRYNYYGRGFSDRPMVRYDGALYERQISDLVETLGLQKPFDLIGLSMGGMVAAAYATAHPEAVRRIAFIDPAYRQYPSPGRPEWLSDMLFVLSQQDATAESQVVDFIEPENFPDWIDRYKIQMRFKGFRHSRISTFYHFTTIDHQENFRFLGQSGIPMLLLWGKQDVTVPFVESRVVADLTGAEFYPVAGAAHLPHLEQPEIVNPIIVEFFSRQELESED